MKVFLGSTLLAATALGAAACGGSRPVATSPIQDVAVSHPAATMPTSSRLIQHRQILCTATVVNPARAGRPLRVSFRVHNVTDHTVSMQLAFASLWLVVHGADGTTYDTRVPYEHMMSVPYVPPTTIKPGATETRSIPYLRVRWGGPLRITPGCGTTKLPQLHVAVRSPGAPQNDRAAVDDVVAAAGHLLDHCRPHASGVSVVGRIDPPSGHAPPLPARCSVTLRRERGFDVAQVLVVSPPTMQGVRIQEPYEGLTGTNALGGNTEAIAWQFVVTRRGATSVYSAEADTSRAGKPMAPDWTWSSSGPGGHPGGSRCGGSGSGFGGVNGPDVLFVSVCSG